MTMNIKWTAMLLAGAAMMTPLTAAHAQDADEAPVAETMEMEAAAPADSSASQKAGMDAMMKMMADLFDTSDLPPVDPARLELATVTAAKMIPDGAYARLMDDVVGKMMGSMFSGDAAFNDIGIAMKTGVDYEVIGALDADKKAAVQQLLDPNAKQRGEVMSSMFRPMMTDIMAELEPALREGMARAYARKFTAPELTTINGFFATPSGGKFANESFVLFADPEVMQASFKVMPLMMDKIMGSESDFKAKMEALPKERQLSDLSDAELTRLAGLLGTSVDAIKEHRDMSATTDDYSDDAAMAAADAAAAAAGEAVDAAVDSYGPWYERENWSDADREQVEKLEAASDTAANAFLQAQQDAIDAARDRLEVTDVAAPPTE